MFLYGALVITVLACVVILTGSFTQQLGTLMYEWRRATPADFRLDMAMLGLLPNGLMLLAAVALLLALFGEILLAVLVALLVVAPLAVLAWFLMPWAGLRFGH